MDQSCQVIINNESSYHLRYQKAELKKGKWDPEPVKDIGPNAPSAIAFFSRGHHFLPGGCQGTVWYQIGDDANTTVKIYFSVLARPSTNEVTAESSNKKFTTTLTGLKGKGNSESCIVTVSEARR